MKSDSEFPHFHFSLKSAFIKEGKYSMPNYKIIPLCPENYSRCEAGIWGSPEDAGADEFWSEFLSGNRKIFAAVRDGEFLGEIAMVYEKNDGDYTIPGQRVYLSRLGVKESCRRNGVGGALVDFLLQQAARESFSEVSVGVNVDNFIARRLYEKKGFTTLLFHGKDEFGEYVKLLKYLKEPTEEK